MGATPARSATEWAVIEAVVSDSEGGVLPGVTATLTDRARGTVRTAIQVEFNPLRVSAYRLIGYENRLLANEDFNDDRKDAGEIGAGHSVTALYELVPAGGGGELPGVDPLKYQSPSSPSAAASGSELLTVKLRYKAPGGKASRLMEVALDGESPSRPPSADFKFAAAVAEFGMLLRAFARRRSGELRERPRAGPGRTGRRSPWLPAGVRESGGAGANAHRRGDPSLAPEVSGEGEAFGGGWTSALRARSTAPRLPPCGGR
jgi:Ca-activated chloride channel family protein